MKKELRTFSAEQKMQILRYTEKRGPAAGIHMEDEG